MAVSGTRGLQFLLHVSPHYTSRGVSPTLGSRLGVRSTRTHTLTVYQPLYRVVMYAENFAPVFRLSSDLRRHSFTCQLLNRYLLVGFQPLPWAEFTGVSSSLLADVAPGQWWLGDSILTLVHSY